MMSTFNKLKNKVLNQQILVNIAKPLKVCCVTRFTDNSSGRWKPEDLLFNSNVRQNAIHSPFYKTTQSEELMLVIDQQFHSNANNSHCLSFV